MLTVGPTPAIFPPPAFTALQTRLAKAGAALQPSSTGDQAKLQLPAAGSTAKPRVVFFGSSTTEGAGASRRDRRYTALVSQYLGWEEINAGKGGSRLTNQGQGAQGVPPSALMRWQTDVAAKKPDRIVLMYGANDMHKKVPMSQYKPAIAELLTNLKGVVGPANLVVATPQPVLKTAGNRPIYDAALEEGAKAAGLASIDAEHCLPPEQLAEFSHDNWHLNDLGHAALASYMAAQMTDLGWAPKAPVATGGNAVTASVAPMAAGKMLVDDTTPLSAGELGGIAAQFTGSGTAVLGVVRPNKAGGLDLVYKTGNLAVTAGTHTVDVPRWRVLDGDRLAVWTSGTSIAGSASRSGRTLAVTTEGKKPLCDVKKGEGQAQNHTLALKAVP
jgi:lysophospholipase L1-like esterase